MKKPFTTEYTEVTEYGKSKKLKSHQFLLCVLRVLCGSIFFVSPVFAKPPLVPDTAPLEIPIPAFDVKTLPCGLKVIFLKNDDLPLVALMNSAMREGGAGKLSPEAFDEALENRAASMTASADHESFGAGFNCLA